VITIASLWQAERSIPIIFLGEGTSIEDTEADLSDRSGGATGGW
jgi:hypothetical protein